MNCSGCELIGLGRTCQHNDWCFSCERHFGHRRFFLVLQEEGRAPQPFMSFDNPAEVQRLSGELAGQSVSAIFFQRQGQGFRRLP